MKIRVYYEDTDLGGVVYHTNYLKYCERARSEFFFTENIFTKIDGGYFVVRDMDMKFIKSAKFGDILEIKNKILTINNFSFKLEQFIYKNNILYYKTYITLAFIKKSKLTIIPQFIKDKLKEI